MPTMRTGTFAAAPARVRDALMAAKDGTNPRGGRTGDLYVDAHVGGSVVVLSLISDTVTTYPRGYPLVSHEYIGPPSNVRDRMRVSDGSTTAYFRVSAVATGMSTRAIVDLFAPGCRDIARRGFGVWDQHSPMHMFIDLTGILPRLHMVGPRVVATANAHALLYRRRTRGPVRGCARRTHTIVHWNTCTRMCVRLRVCDMTRPHSGASVTLAGHAVITSYGYLAGFDEFGRWTYELWANCAQKVNPRADDVTHCLRDCHH